MPNDLRRIEVKPSSSGSWQPVQIEHAPVGNTARAFEIDGTPVVADGRTEFAVIGGGIHADGTRYLTVAPTGSRGPFAHRRDILNGTTEVRQKKGR